MEEKKKMNVKYIIFVIICLLLSVSVAWIIVSAFAPYKPPKNIVCAGNLHSLGIAYFVHHKIHKGWPNKENWCGQLQLLADVNKRSWNYLRCPADKTGPCSYAMNENIPADANDLPPDLVLLFESTPGWNQTGGPDDVITDRHGKPGANIAFADGTVRFASPEEIPKLRWTVEQ